MSTTDTVTESGTNGAEAGTLDLAVARRDFPALDQQVHGRPLVYLDNAATTQKPRQVIEAVSSFYSHDNANVHRGIHELSMRATEAYEGARERVAAFFGIRDAAELIWTRGTTESLNLVASSWGLSNLREGDEVLLTSMEHHANLVPWQMVAARTGARLRFFELDAEQRLDLSALDTMLTERTRVVSIGHVSNALGTVNPVREIADRARAVGAVVVVDGAQSAGHLPVRVAELGCDFYAFSAHKMCGPTGVGGLWGRAELLQQMPPWQGGGDMIDRVELERATYAAPPHRFEAGTPNIAGVVGTAAAVDYLERVGLEAIRRHDQELMAYALERLPTIPGLRIFGPRNPAERSGVVPFAVDGIHPHDLATVLDVEGVAIRAGHHCAQPLMGVLGVAATARASFYLYNRCDEIDRLVDAIHAARRMLLPGGTA